MISQETAQLLWSAHREITTGEKLLSDMANEARFAAANKFEPTLKDAFGRVRNLQLGIPCGENSHRLFDVSPAVAEAVIRAHIARKTAELAELNERARIELDATP